MFDKFPRYVDETNSTLQLEIYVCTLPSRVSVRSPVNSACLHYTAFPTLGFAGSH